MDDAVDLLTFMGSAPILVLVMGGKLLMLFLMWRKRDEAEH